MKLLQNWRKHKDQIGLTNYHVSIVLPVANVIVGHGKIWFISFGIIFFKTIGLEKFGSMLALWARLFKINDVVVNVSLKFQTLISDIRQYFLSKKCEKLIFSTKNFSVFGYKVVKHLTS